MIVRASQQEKIRLLLPGIVSLLHQAGALVLIEGIETKEQAMIALECDADFVQGYYFAKPQPDLEDNHSTASKFSNLFSGYKNHVSQKTKDSLNLIERYKTIFYEAVKHLETGKSIKKSCQQLFLDPSIVRAYQLRPDGIQIEETVHRQEEKVSSDIRYRPIQSGKSADWFRRHYLQRAIFHPNQMQITRPYLSITGAHMCVTLSLMFALDGENRVFCCDINW